jgi:hypothetical protein
LQLGAARALHHDGEVWSCTLDHLAHQLHASRAPFEAAAFADPFDLFISDNLWYTLHQNILSTSPPDDFPALVRVCV